MILLKRVSAYQSLIFLWMGLIVISVAGLWFSFSQLLASYSNFNNQPQIMTIEPRLQVASPEARPVTSAQYMWVYDRNTESVLIDQNANVATAPASLAKIMTALVAYDQLDLNQPILIASAAAISGNRAKFLASDIFLAKDLMRAMLMFSANDAAQALANAANDTNFASLMNQKAQDLGLTQTHFSNPTGLDQNGQHSSAKELGLITNELLKIPSLAQIVSEQRAILTEQRTKRQDVVYSTNVMLRRGEQYQGVKTGTTDLAGENLILRVVDDWTLVNEPEVTQSVDLILVILGSQDRYQDAQNIIEWLTDHVKLEQN